MQSPSPGLAFTTRRARKLHGYDSSPSKILFVLNHAVQKYYVKVRWCCHLTHYLLISRVVVERVRLGRKHVRDFREPIGALTNPPEFSWEPTDSFQGGSEHILESFWERIDAGGRDISDATAFKKGEELVVSGPPGILTSQWFNSISSLTKYTR